MKIRYLMATAAIAGSYGITNIRTTGWVTYELQQFAVWLNLFSNSPLEITSR